MRVVGLWRYPVKSLRGEALAAADVVERGLVADRAWAVLDPDGKIGSGKSTRRFRAMDGLLELSSALRGDEPVVRFPDGWEFGPGEDLDEALSAHVGRTVRLAAEGAVMHHDDGPVHVLTTAALRAVADLVGHEVPVERFRPNLLLDVGGCVDVDGSDAEAELDWVGRVLTVGGVRLRVAAGMPRCVMVTMAQASLAADGTVLKAVTELTGGDLGVWCTVERPGRIELGADVELA
ncbi:MAG: MOSC domain-containing protein [Motilibacteraceae bacterium]